MWETSDREIDAWAEWSRARARLRRKAEMERRGDVAMFLAGTILALILTALLYTVNAIQMLRAL